jgi:ribosome modulation factor
MSFKNEGRAAYFRGTGISGAPYPDWERQSQWVKGWHAAKHDHQLALSSRQPRRYLEAKQSSFL